MANRLIMKLLATVKEFFSQDYPVTVSSANSSNAADGSAYRMRHRQTRIRPGEQ